MKMQTINERKYMLAAILVTFNAVLLIYLRVSYIKEQRRLFITNYYDERDNNATFDQNIDEQLKETMHMVDYITNIKKQVQVINEGQKIHNVYLHGPVRKNTIVMIIQVHSNEVYIKELVDSLKLVKGITKTLLVFSHDYFDYDVNRIIRNITFAKYMQIFYPFSVQLHPKIFPGKDSRFCSNGYNCRTDGNRRNAKLSQRKHHWWWQANKVFDNLEATANYDGTVVFLEENNIVTEDLIYMLKILELLKAENCPRCEMISLGAHPPSLAHYHIRDGFTVVEEWSPKLSNLGIAFNRSVWNEIKKLDTEFCNFNDVNWDSSLRYIGTKKPSGKFLMMSLEGPRVFRVEKCSDDFSVTCNVNHKIQKIHRYMKVIKRGLYPRNMIIRHDDDGVDSRTCSGGFEDVRDRELCMYFSKYG